MDKGKIMHKVYYNGKIITMVDNEEEGVPNMPEAVMIENGVIKEVGSLNSIKRCVSEDVQWVDLQGKCLMPAFIDTHSHIVLNGQISMFVSLLDCQTFDEIVEVLSRYKENNKIMGT